jgi:toxin-antitoxin system PIN domain toxin
VKFLADLNVVFPLLVSRHAHREKAVEWFDGAEAGEVVLCRLTRLSVLRLLCTAQIMGPDVLQPKAAIKALEILEADERVALLHEPDGVDAKLKTLVATCATTPNLWTDAYLAAFASVAGLKLVSFDRGFAKFAGLDFLLLASSTASHPQDFD